VIRAVPADTPVTTPVEELTVAIETEPLVHSPPEGEDDRVVVEPAHTEKSPVIGVRTGRGLIVNLTSSVDVQPWLVVIVIVPL